VKQDGGIIYAEDGRAIVAFRSNDPKRIRFRYFLKSFEEPNEDLRECICHYKSGDLIVFPMKLPHKGKYTLEMYAKVVDRTGASTRWRCTPRWSSTQGQVHAGDVRQGGRAHRGKYTLEMYAKVVERTRASTRWRCTPRWSNTAAQGQVHAGDVRQGGRSGPQKARQPETEEGQRQGEGQKER